jgi:hypothetical protein
VCAFDHDVACALLLLDGLLLSRKLRLPLLEHETEINQESNADEK